MGPGSLGLGAGILFSEYLFPTSRETEFNLALDKVWRKWMRGREVFRRESQFTDNCSGLHKH